MSLSGDIKDCLNGAIDLHVHTLPDVMPRIIDDIKMAKIVKDMGMGGFVIKSHYLPTAERAEIVTSIIDNVKVIGGIVLNSSVGGINPTAVEISARSNARIVWMPTADSENEFSRWRNPEENAPYWAQIRQELRAKGLSTNPISIWQREGKLKEEVYKVLDIIAEYDLVLATGHLSPEEGIKLIEEARKRKVRKILVTHPDFPSTKYSLQQQRNLASMGIYLERCFSTAYTGKVSWEEMMKAIKETGEMNIISTDLGQINSPLPTEGFRMFIEKLIKHNFPLKLIQRMAIDNPSKLVL
jgi:hypothetical protein